MNLLTLFQAELDANGITWCQGQACEKTSSHHRGFAVKDTRTIHLDRKISTRSTLHRALHEVGHIVNNEKGMLRWEKEQAANDFAELRLRDLGIQVPRAAAAKGDLERKDDVMNCPKCSSPATTAGALGCSGIRDGVPFSENIGEQYSCGRHTWQVDLEKNVTVLPEVPLEPDPPPIPIFDEWASINQVICSGRSRFDVLREELPKCKTKSEVQRWLQREQFSARYPILPNLPD